MFVRVNRAHFSERQDSRDGKAPCTSLEGMDRQSFYVKFGSKVRNVREGLKTVKACVCTHTHTLRTCKRPYRLTKAAYNINNFSWQYRLSIC